VRLFGRGDDKVAKMSTNHMQSEQSSDVKFEIGHVLFIDIVGYSKLLITEQSELLQTTRPRKLIGTPA
jgi:hypothetical protein